MDAANFIFSNILSAEMGEMEYGEDESLHFGAGVLPAPEGLRDGIPPHLRPPEVGGK